MRKGVRVFHGKFTAPGSTYLDMSGLHLERKAGVPTAWRYRWASLEKCQICLKNVCIQTGTNTGSSGNQVHFPPSLKPTLESWCGSALALWVHVEDRHTARPQSVWLSCGKSRWQWGGGEPAFNEWDSPRQGAHTSEPPFLTVKQQWDDV